MGEWPDNYPKVWQTDMVLRRYFGISAATLTRWRVIPLMALTTGDLPLEPARHLIFAQPTARCPTQHQRPPSGSPPPVLEMDASVYNLPLASVPTQSREPKRVSHAGLGEIQLERPEFETAPKALRHKQKECLKRGWNRSTGGIFGGTFGSAVSIILIK